MNGESAVGIAFEQHFEGVQIKRGTRFEEFLDKFFLVKSFVFAECGFCQYDLRFRPAQRVQVIDPSYRILTTIENPATSAIPEIICVSAFFRQKR